ncbi:MAG: branched-chain amino acid aminotransferase [Balneolaceae bacterium]
MEIKITQSRKTRISEVDFDKLDFGRTFSDHMFEMTWKNGSWEQPEIKPYGEISFTPALNVLHYGQAVFEGMKGYFVDDKTLHLFRPRDHHQRLNDSSTRLCIPTTSYEIFIEALGRLLRLDSEWVPRKKGRALYIRPHIFACEEYLAARVSEKYRFYIITSPVAAYYGEGFNPVRLTTTEGFVRAVKGGTGEAKAAGNYAASFFPARKAQQEGYTQVLWLDAIENRYIEEVGTMNIFFLIDEKLVTPRLTGSVLNGITRRSVIALAERQGVPVEERRITIDEVFEASGSGKLEEVFGSGTAAVISPVGLIHHNGRSIDINKNKIGPFAKKMFDTITGIQYGEIEDPFGWTHKIEL